MPAIRILIIAGAIFLVFLLARQLLSSKKRTKDPVKQVEDDGQIVACEQCGVHVPERELIVRDAKRLCHQCSQRHD